MTGSKLLDELPRVEDFRADFTQEQVLAAEALNTRALAMQAYLHAFPAFLHMRQLTEFIQGRKYFAPTECPLGGWVLMRDLATPTTTTVSPNVDTLYGASYLLLDQQGPVMLSVPPISDRYYSVAILDAYFNNFAIVSPCTYGNTGGEYLIVPPGWSGEPPAGTRAVLQAPTPSICLLQRIFTRNQAEYETLHALQDAIHLTPLDRWRQGESGFPLVDLSAYEISGMRMVRDPLQFFEYTNFYTGINPPSASDGGLMELFRTAGVGPSSQLPDDSESLQAIRQGAADAQAVINARISAGALRNGWRVPDQSSGLAGPHFLARAVAQATQMGLFPLQEAIYFFAYRDGENQALHGDRRYTITFKKDELPPLHEFGFWSLTMYNDSSLLADNRLNRYVLRPDSPELTFAPDGSLTLHIQHDLPAGAPQGNWLPAPEDAFNVALRTYLPQATIVDGTWFPPAIERVN